MEHITGNAGLLPDRSGEVGDRNPVLPPLFQPVDQLQPFGVAGDQHPQPGADVVAVGFLAGGSHQRQRRHLRHGERTEKGAGIAVRHPGAETDEFAPFDRVREQRAKNGAAHRRAVSRRDDAAFAVGNPGPEPDSSPQRRPAAAERQENKPVAQPPAEGKQKTLDVAAGGKHRLRGHDGQFGVVADHAAAEQEALPQRAGEPPGPCSAAETLSGQPEGIPGRRAEQQPGDPRFACIIHSDVFSCVTGNNIPVPPEKSSLSRRGISADSGNKDRPMKSPDSAPSSGRPRG